MRELSRDSWVGTVVTLLVLVIGAGSAWGQDDRREIDLDPPGSLEFVLDRAGLIEAADREAIVAACTTLLTEHATPIIVVTIDRMAEHTRFENLRVETFARLLFDQWQIGHPELNGRNWNTGILLLVAAGDRKARIELGAGWGHEKDAVCQQIMDEQIVPRFKTGEFSAGIRAGVDALDRMARGKDLPRPPLRKRFVVLWLLFGGLVVFTVVSLIRRGSGGWAWLFWGAVLTVIGTVLYHAAKSRSSGGGSGGGFSGGSFGGGFSGGGGASGSW